MSNTDQTFKASGARPSRRSVVKGAAWAVPAIAVAATVPMASASCVPQAAVDPSQSCKKASAKTYRLVFFVANSCDPTNPEYGCSIVINAIYESTGKGNPLWVAGQGGDGSATNPIYICNATNMAATTIVNATITCNGTTYPAQDYPVTMPQYTSANSLCTNLNWPC